MSDIKTCGWCGLDLPVLSFGPHKRSRDGLAYHCKVCHARYEDGRRRKLGVLPKVRSVIDGDSKKCHQCEEMKSFADFSPSKRGLLGLSAYCKVCLRTRYQNAEKTRKATAAYRKRHTARWRSMHRMNMLKRRTGIAAVSDGTVTDTFLKNLYLEEFCSYCFKATLIDNRTADHVVPLSKNGKHSASNLVMACFSCNSAKSSRPVEEFKESLKCLTK